MSTSQLLRALVPAMPVALALLVTATARAQCPSRAAHLAASDGRPWDGFGALLALDGDVLVATCGGCDDLGDSAGAAYVMRWDGTAWNEEAKLFAADPEPRAVLASSVAVSGDTILLGARRSDGTVNYRTGAAYVFRHVAGAWIQEARLEASDGEPANEFGLSVALDGDTALIGAPGNDWLSDNATSGAAYVFVRQGASWTEEARLDPSAGQLNDRFGYAVALDGERAVAGARLHDIAGGDEGAVFVFERSGSRWIETAMLTGPDVRAGDGLGTHVAVSADTVVATCPGDDTSGPNAGSVRVYVRDASTWRQQARLAPTDGDGGGEDSFGSAVAIEGDTLVIGSWQDDDRVWNGGAAYVFWRSGDVWRQLHKHLPNVANGHDWLGTGVALSGSVAAAGIQRADDRGESSGALDVFDACQPPLSVLRNARLTERSLAQLRANVRPGMSPALDPVRDLHATDVTGQSELVVSGDATAVGSGVPGVMVLYELMEATRDLRVSRRAGDIILSGW